MRVKISVYDKTTDKDVTGEEKWYLGVDGKLYLVTNDADSPLKLASEENYYTIGIIPE